MGIQAKLFIISVDLIFASINFVSESWAENTRAGVQSSYDIIIREYIIIQKTINDKYLTGQTGIYITLLCSLPLRFLHLSELVWIFRFDKFFFKSSKLQFVNVFLPYDFVKLLNYSLLLGITRLTLCQTAIALVVVEPRLNKINLKLWVLHGWKTFYNEKVIRGRIILESNPRLINN